MSVIDRIFRRQDTVTPAIEPVIDPIIEPASFAMWLSDCPSLLVGYRRLSDCPEVVAAVNVYAELISSMTIYLMENGKKGDVRIRNALSALVDIAPNPWMSKRQFYSNVVRVMLLYGDGNQVTVPVIKNGLIDRLVPLRYDKLKFIDDSEGYYVRYADKRNYKPDQILHFRINPDPKRPWLGTGYARLLADAVMGMAQASKTKRSIMEQPMPSLIVKVDALTDEFASEEGRKTLGERFASSREDGRPWFIPTTLMDVEQVKPLTMRDLAIADHLELDIRQVAAVFGVPAFMVGIGEFNKDEFNNFVRTRVMPLARAIEQELTRQILIKDDWYFQFNPRSLMAYDMSEIVEAGGAMVDRMAMSRNELRDWIGMSPDDRMDELLALENYIPQEMLGKQKKLVEVQDGEN